MRKGINTLVAEGIQRPPYKWEMPAWSNEEWIAFGRSCFQQQRILGVALAYGILKEITIEPAHYDSFSVEYVVDGCEPMAA